MLHQFSDKTIHCSVILHLYLIRTVRVSKGNVRDIKSSLLFVVHCITITVAKWDKRACNEYLVLTIEGWVTVCLIGSCLMYWNYWPQQQSSVDIESGLPLWQDKAQGCWAMFVLVVATICAQIAVFTTGIQGRSPDIPAAHTRIPGAQCTQGLCLLCSTHCPASPPGSLTMLSATWVLVAQFHTQIYFKRLLMESFISVLTHKSYHYVLS